MPVGLAVALANATLDAIRTDTPFVQLHLGDPGAAGTSNPATETTRKAATFGAAAGGSMTTTAVMTWTGIAGSEDATHFSVWNAAVAGTFKMSGPITANPYTAGDTVNVAIGACTLSVGVAS